MSLHTSGHCTAAAAADGDECDVDDDDEDGRGYDGFVVVDDITT